MALQNTLLISCLLFIISLSPLLTSAAHNSTDDPLHFHFYMHFAENDTEVLVAKSPIKVPGSFYNFGSIVVIDSPLTEAINDTTHSVVGKLQGSFAVMNSLTVVWNANLVFTTGQYNGSYVSIVGADDITLKVREVAIVGGSGTFRRATGYVLIKTVWVDFDTGDAEAEVDAYVYLDAKKDY